MIQFYEWIQNHPKNLCAFSIKYLLFFPVSLIFSCVVFLRNFAYDQNIFTSKHLKPTVISVGNLVAGGTGKTPFTLFLASSLEENFNFSLVSRGYKGKAEKLGSPCRISYGDGPIFPSSFCGDEPYLISKRMPLIKNYIGRSKIEAASLAASDGADIIVVDDGFQHRKLARDFDLLVLDAREPFGRGGMLPYGTLREPKASLKRADLIVINNVDSRSIFESVKQKLADFTKAPVIGTKVIDKGLYQGLQCRYCGPSIKNTIAFCGIAQPNRFFDIIRKKGVEIVSCQIADDHASFSTKQLLEMIEEAKKFDLSCLVCTEKDFVKISPKVLGKFKLLFLKIDVEIAFGQPKWVDFLHKLLVKSVS